MKCCEICGTFNFKENNYCIHCGNKLLLENICSYCGKVNSDDSEVCIKCNRKIKPVAINDFDRLFSKSNEQLLSNFEIDDLSYHSLLVDIFKRLEYTEIAGKTPKERILNLARVFADCRTKSRGRERGFNLANVIFYDDRMDDSVQIATIIHELAHNLLFLIVEKLVCYIFDVKYSTTLQSFVWYFLTLPDISIMNEYCAHTVEGRFIPYGYQNYSSFDESVSHTDIDDDKIINMVVLGNSFANEIIVFLEKYIEEELRYLIKLQYKKDLKQAKYDSIMLESDAVISLDVKNRIFIDKLYSAFKSASNPETRKELEFIKEGLEQD